MNEPTDTTSRVLARQVDDILVITLDSPSTRNAITRAMAHEMAIILDELDADDILRAAVITGSSGTFCSGANLKRYALGEDPSVPGRGFAGMTQSIRRKPLIAAVEGFAMGGGFEIALACDLIVAADNAEFALPEVRHGLVASGGGLLRLPRRIPHHVAMECILTGRGLTASRAHHFGLVNEITSPGRAMSAAMALARAISANDRLAVEASKYVALMSHGWNNEDMFERQAAHTDLVHRSGSARAGAKAFADRQSSSRDGTLHAAAHP